MIRLIEALNYRCLRHVSRELQDFQILVGPNAGGKSTFLDVPAFLSRLVSDGLEAAINERARIFEDLVWRRAGSTFEMAVELELPRKVADLPTHKGFHRVRYEIDIRRDEATRRIVIQKEKVALIEHRAKQASRSKKDLEFPSDSEPPPTISTHKPEGRIVLRKTPVGKHRDIYYPEAGTGAPEELPFNLGAGKCTLANLPEDESTFPAAVWLKDVLKSRFTLVQLSTEEMKKPAPDDLSNILSSTGGNLPWLVAHLESNHPEEFRDWIEHVRTALPDLRSIESVEKPEERSRYLVAEFSDHVKIPSWLLSDGTLRLLALTIIPYVGRPDSVYLIEEPENGIHPTAIETVIDSLRSVYDGQVVLATHSSVVLSVAGVSEVLCFARTESGATSIIPGSEHPDLADWKGVPNLSVLFASGILG